MEINLEVLAALWPRDRQETSAPPLLANTLFALTGGAVPDACYTHVDDAGLRATTWRLLAVQGSTLIEVRATVDNFNPDNARLELARLVRVRDAVRHIDITSISSREGNNDLVRVAWSVELRDGGLLELPVKEDQSYAEARRQADAVALALINLLQQHP